MIYNGNYVRGETAYQTSHTQLLILITLHYITHIHLNIKTPKHALLRLSK